MKFKQLMLGVVHGAMLLVIAALYMMSSYEDQLYDQIVTTTIADELSEQQQALLLLNKTHELLKPRFNLLGAQDKINLRDTLFRSADAQLMDAKEACGSHTHVLGRLLQRAGFEIRIAQMKCANEWSCHIVLEARINGRFAALDALYDLAFRKQDGTLASFKEVGKNWSKYRQQVPVDYEQSYNYSDVRYTNWNKIPVLMPALEKLLSLAFGETVETLSLRSYVLNLYQTYLIIIVIAYLILLPTSFYLMRRLGPTT